MSEELLTAETATSLFNERMSRFVSVLGLKAEDVVRVESARLMREAIRVSPPDDQAKTKKRISNLVRSKFNRGKKIHLGMDRAAGLFYKNWKSGETHFGQGTSGVEWFGATPKSLYGIDKSNDRWALSLDELLKLFYMPAKEGAKVFPFAHSNRAQKVVIIEAIFTNPQAMALLVKELQSHVGRLKAGWLISFNALGVKTGPAIPAYVQKNLPYAESHRKGAYIDGLGVKDYPTFTMGNTAAGVGNEVSLYYMRVALVSRAQSMKRNFEMLFEGKKELSAY